MAIDRNGHDDPYFVDLTCSLPHPFICEEKTKSVDKTGPWPGAVVDIEDTQYILYHGRLSWTAAVSYCRQQGYILATIENMTVSNVLSLIDQ